MLFHVACDKEAVVVDYMRWLSGVLHWDVLFARAIHDWEMRLLWTFLYYVKISRDGEDWVWWIPDRSGSFGVKSYYQILNTQPPLAFPWKSIWKVWTSLLRLLSSHGWQLGGASLSWIISGSLMFVVLIGAVCGRISGETADHLLLHCAFASELWSMVFCLFGLQWVMPERVVDFLAW